LYRVIKLMMISYGFLFKKKSKHREVTARTWKGWNTKLDADRYKVQCLEAFCASLRSISAMNKSIHTRRIKYKREKSQLHDWRHLSLSLSLSLSIYIFFSSRPRRVVAVVVAVHRKEIVCKMEREMRDNWPIIVDRDDTGALAELFTNRRARPNSIWHCVNAHWKKREMKRE